MIYMPQQVHAPINQSINQSLENCEDTKEVIRRRKLTRDRQYNGHKCEDTKEVIRRRKLTRDRQYNGQKCEDTKDVIRSRKSTRDRQYNGQKCEDTKDVIKSVTRRGTDNTTAKSVKIP